MAESSSTAIAAVISWIVGVANSNFTTALAGAAAGAYGAQWITEKTQSKRRILEEIRSTNAAIMVAFGIVNTFCGLKRQHVARLSANFSTQRKQLLEFQKRRALGLLAPGEIFEFQADFQTLQLPPSPIDTLQKLLYEKISVTGRPLALVNTLAQTIGSLDGSLKLRNSVIETCKAQSRSNDALVRLYFGLPDQRGHRDENYPHSVEAIATHTDDCIFFSKLILEDLVRHGEKLRPKMGSDAPKIHQPDFSKAIALKLIPDESQYADLLTSFGKQASDLNTQKQLYKDNPLNPSLLIGLGTALGAAAALIIHRIMTR